MPCSCCESGRCCNGSTCTATNKSQCVYNSGTFTAGGTCATQACISTSGNGPCSLANGCACAAAGKTLINTNTCNCNTITGLGYATGGCDTQACYTCNTSTGACVYNCPAPRACCYGVCCPEPQRCGAGQVCVDLCAAGTTYCNTTTSSYSYSCCTAAQKCCGPSGCQAYVSTSGGALLNSAGSPGSDGWLDTAFTFGAGDRLTITATGSGTTEGVATSPTGKAGDCANANRFSASFCYLALIGKIGTTGTPFLVGASYGGSPGAGRLYLRVNRTNYVGGSEALLSGDLSINIVREADPCPGFTPAAIGEPIVYGEGESPAEPSAGPGVELKALLKLAGIVASPTCSCNARAVQMDMWGEWECLKRLPEICGWLKEEAQKRDLWFFPPAGVVLILAAISLAALKRPFRGINR